MTCYKDTTLIIIKHLIENSKDELESIEFFISDIKKRIRLEQNVRSEISYQDIFSQIFNHLFDHHPELKLRASLLIENNTLDDDLQTQISLASWAERQYINPIPATVKRHVLFRHKIKDATWIETGTANGDTTLFLSQFAPLVYSIEPFEGFYLSSSVRFLRWAAYSANAVISACCIFIVAF